MKIILIILLSSFLFLTACTTQEAIPEIKIQQSEQSSGGVISPPVVSGAISEGDLSGEAQESITGPILRSQSVQVKTASGKMITVTPTFDVDKSSLDEKTKNEYREFLLEVRTYEPTEGCGWTSKIKNEEVFFAKYKNLLEKLFHANYLKPFSYGNLGYDPLTNNPIHKLENGSYGWYFYSIPATFYSSSDMSVIKYTLDAIWSDNTVALISYGYPLFISKDNTDLRMTTGGFFPSAGVGGCYTQGAIRENGYLETITGAGDAGYASNYFSLYDTQFQEKYSTSYRSEEGDDSVLFPEDLVLFSNYDTSFTIQYQLPEDPVWNNLYILYQKKDDNKKKILKNIFLRNGSLYDNLGANGHPFDTKHINIGTGSTSESLDKEELLKIAETKPFMEGDLPLLTLTEEKSGQYRINGYFSESGWIDSITVTSCDKNNSPTYGEDIYPLKSFSEKSSVFDYGISMKFDNYCISPYLFRFYKDQELQYEIPVEIRWDRKE